MVVRLLLTVLGISILSVVAAGNNSGPDGDLQASLINADLVSDTLPALLLTEELRPDQALVWYLFHCGYAVKTKSKLLIFDYVRRHWTSQENPTAPSLANGWINPEEIKDLDVYVFVSHPHGDHFDSTIFSWQKIIPNITYFFGWDAADGSQFHNMVGPRATFKDDKIEVYTINSHHSGVPEVAYLVKTDSLAIYHGGDYNANYKADLPYLAGFIDRLDFAMANDWCGDPIVEMIKQLKPKIVFPGHEGGKEYNLTKLADCAREQNWSCAINPPGRRGEFFRYNCGAP